MLAKVAPPSNNFHALARYLVRGKSGEPDLKRVAWLFTHNLPTDDPLLAAKYMEATAQLSARTRKAAYHLMIAWHADERPTPGAMQNVARQTLQMAGLAEHQALIMGHGDKPHPHLHILLNRIHPDTGRAWKTTHDFARFDRIMRDLAEAHGFAFVPAHAYNPEQTAEQPKQPNSPAAYAAKRGAPTHRLQHSRRSAADLGKLLSEGLTRDSTTDDVFDLLHEQGLELEAKGAGHVIGNADGYVKLSSVPLDGNAHGLNLLRQAAAALVASPRHNRRPVFTVDGVDITRAFMTLGLSTKDDLAAAIDDRKRERSARRPQATTSTMLTPLITKQEAQPSRRSPRPRSTRRADR